MTAEIFEIAENPIIAASEIATNKWSSSDTAVLAVDGSSLTDEINTLFDQEVTYSCEKEVTTYAPEDLKERK